MLKQLLPIFNELNRPYIVCNSKGDFLHYNALSSELFNDFELSTPQHINVIDSSFDFKKIKSKKTLSKTITIKSYCLDSTVNYICLSETEFIVYVIKPFMSIDKSTDIVMEHIDDVIILFDEGGKLRKMNSICDEILPFKRKEVINRAIDDLIVEGFVSNPVMKEMIIQRKTLHRNISYPNGKIIAYTATPIFDDANVFKGGILTGRDITRIIRLMSHVNTSHSKICAEHYISQSAILEQIKEMCVKAASTDSSVFITGESGTGKEVLANMIHNYSNRRERPFTAINCGAIPSELLESEFFGYEEGAFTGSKRGGRKGLLEESSGGTIFLDEIGELPSNMQTKLLRVIQELQISRVGSNETIPIDIRFICATNVPICELKANKSFRLDLYYRLSVVPINIPPLRERPDDILPLVEHFLKAFNEKYCRKLKFSSEALDMLTQYSWPGNIRELKNIVERLMILNSNETVSKSDLSFLLTLDAIEPYDSDSKNIDIHGYHNLHEAYTAVDQVMIPSAIRRYGSIVKAAEKLGINPSTIHRKIKDGDIFI